jgi:hypothetical protein
VTKSVLEEVAERYFAPKKLTAWDPVRYANTTMNTSLWSEQVCILESVRDNRYTVVPSAHDLGKTFLASVASAAWLGDTDAHPLGEAFVVSTAPTAQQVSAILWREIKKHHKRCNLPGYITMGGQPEWKLDDGELVGYGRKPADYDDTGFQGLHARFVLIIADEAAGIPKQLWDAIDAIATNENARVLAIGNPKAGQTHFRSVCNVGSGWNRIHLDGLRSPNMTEQAVRQYPELHQYMLEQGIPFSTEKVSPLLREHLLSPLWVYERMQRWGVQRSEDGTWSTSPLWEEKVRGQFPTDDDWAVIPLSWVEAAIARWYAYDHSREPRGQRTFAVDVARYGDDENAIADRTGYVVHSVTRFGEVDTMTTANRVRTLLEYPASRAVIDVIGVGAGVYDRLVEQGKNAMTFNSSVKTSAKDSTGEFTFPNTRSAAWWNLRELLDPSAGPTLCLPDNEQMVVDLTAPRFTYATGAKIVVEPKENTHKRLGRSPDSGDAVVMAFWVDRKDPMSIGEGFATQWTDSNEMSLAGFVQGWE